ncbi:outer membrane beta-barrel protein [Comamonas sp. JC664]|uniref:outer membrane beta-barrel protein n=1 Tax=Comamonas sp. JC664 TaxID=2801917 RepID=UPI00174CAA13|nr:outer membrane beta-barrel protein [Comamonas sp. JC664]MBL0698296.1 porin [Comamonas sp. JC664]
MLPTSVSPLLSAVLLSQAPSPEPTSDADSPGMLSRLKVEGGVDVYYARNLNRPSDGANFLSGTGTTARRDNEVSINLASLGVSLAPAPVGFKVLLGFGTGIEVLHQAEPAAPSVGPAVWRHLQQATVSYATGPLTLEAGVYPSHIGLESFQSQLNWSYTRSWMGELSPYYQSGLKGTWAFGDTWSAQLHLLNGWQTIGENNRGKALGTQVAYAGPRLSAAFNTFIGEEGDGGLRLFADVVATWKVARDFALAATADVGRQARSGQAAALWYAAGLNARVQLTESVALAARVEAYRDAEGVISGASQTLAGGTLTLEMKPAEHLVLKLEARHDTSSAEVFTGRVTSVDGAPTFEDSETLGVLGAVAYF